MALIFGTPIYGTEGDDVIVDPAGINTIFAHGGDDHITIPHAVVGGEYNYVYGGTGDDIMKVDWGDSILSIFVRDSAVGTVTPVDPIGITQSISYYDIEHLDVTSGSGDDSFIGNYHSWDRFDGGAGVDLWQDSFSDLTTGMAVDMKKVSSSAGQSFADGTVVKNIEGVQGFQMTQGNDSFRDYGDYGDFVMGWGGDDTFRTSGGKDNMSGHEGNDTLIVDWGDATEKVQIENVSISWGWVGEAVGPGGAVGYYSSTRSVDFDLFENLKVFSGSAADDLVGGVSLDVFRAGKGGDTLSGLEGDDRLYGEGGNDRIDGGDGNDILKGGRGKDVLNGGAGADVIDGQAGVDTASYAGSASGVFVDLITETGTGGDAEGDTLTGIENLVGSALDDTLVGNAGVNKLSGGDGSDRLDGKGGSDVLHGGAGRDVLLGSRGSDLLFGEKGNDRLKGGTQGDTLFGGGQADKLFGQGGDDRLDGGAGNDVLTGGTGRDVFVFAAGRDRITDFTNNRDTIELDGAALGLSGQTVTDVLATATVVDGNTEIGFSTGDTLVIEGFTNINALADDMAII